MQNVSTLFGAKIGSHLEAGGLPISAQTPKGGGESRFDIVIFELTLSSALSLFSLLHVVYAGVLS